MTAPSDHQPSSPDKVLLVDDNLDNLQVLYQALEDEGHDLLVAQSGPEALETARQATPALILLDINMPEMDGYETCRQLKADPVTAPAVVMFLSARGALGDKLAGFDCGAVDYIEKPFQFEEVVARVRTQIAIYHRERQLEEAALGADNEVSFREMGEESLAALLAQGEGDSVEFKSTLRFNLRSGKKDKRIENASLKTIAAYLNTKGGVLLVGVGDDGEALGLEPDAFDSEDRLLLHITSLIRNHLGGEVTAFVRFGLQTVGGKSVLFIDCLPSPDPVYFRRDQEEIFYVRSGPSTQQLSPSEIVAYVRNRNA